MFTEDNEIGLFGSKNDMAEVLHVEVIKLLTIEPQGRGKLH